MSPRKRQNERDLIRRFARLVESRSAPKRDIIAGIGDDAAVVRPPASGPLLVTNDVQVEGRHFERAWFKGAELGWRLAAVNLSDIAAMGGVPLYGMLSLVVPDDAAGEYIVAVERGVQDHLARYGATVIGGNLSGTKGPLVCELTLLGRGRPGGTWRRTCRPGRDAIVLVGRLGDARAGLECVDSGLGSRRRLVRAYKRPEPLLNVARRLGGERGVHGAIDVSDGFSTDLAHLCEGGGAGAEVDAGNLPASRALASYCRERGADPLDYVLHGGEDYALILSVDRRRADQIAKRIRDGLGIPARIVGRFTRRPKGRLLLTQDGRAEIFEPRGWDHFR